MLQKNDLVFYTNPRSKYNGQIATVLSGRDPNYEMCLSSSGQTEIRRTMKNFAFVQFRNGRKKQVFVSQLETFLK